MAMLWCDFLAKLDEIRSEIRATKDVKKDTVSVLDPIIIRVGSLLDEAMGVENSPKPALFSIPDAQLNPFDIPEIDMKAPVFPDSENPNYIKVPKIVEVVERGEGEGRMIVLGRDKPFVPKKPDLQEVLEEELGK